MKITKAVIPAAGLGTRLLPATKAQPKEMLPIVDRPAIQYIVEEAVKSGITDIVIVVGRNKECIADHFDRNLELEMTLEREGKQKLLQAVKDVSRMANFHFVRQPKPIGLGDAVLRAETFVGNEPFAVLLGDDVMRAQVPVTKQLIKAFEKVESSVVGVQEVSLRDISKYGAIDGVQQAERLYLLEHVVEKPDVKEAPSNIAILGRYVLTPEIFSAIRQTERGVDNEIQLTDAIMQLMLRQRVYAYNFAAKRYDVGDRFGYLQANIEFALGNPEVEDRMREYLEHLVNHI